MSNTVNNTRIAKNNLMLYFRMLLSLVVTLYTSRIVLNALGVEDFGIYNVVAGVIIMFGFLNSAMAASTIRFLTYENSISDLIRLRNVFNVSLTIHAIIALIIFVLAETIGLWFLNTYINVPIERMNAVNWVYQFSIFTFIFNVLNAPYNASIIANEKMSVFAFVGIFEVLLKLIVVYLLFIFSYDKLILYAFLLFLISIILRLMEGFYCGRTFEECKNSKLKWDKDLFLVMGNFAGWNLFGVAAGVGYNQGVNIVLNLFFGVTINAARGIAFQVQGAVSSLVTNFQMASAPAITKTYAKGDYKNTNNLVFSTSKFSFYLLLFFAVPILIQTKIILILWLKVVPNYTVIFTQLVMIDILINSLSGSLQILVQATGNIKKYQLIVSGILLLNLPSSYLALKLGYSPEVTIVISIAYSILALFLRLIILKSDISFPLKDYLINVILKVILVGTISIFIPYIINSYFPYQWLNFILISILSTLSIIFAVYIFGLNYSERNFLLAKLSKIFKRN
jgi:O-antigen/teichoic acid export membrane protein